MSFEVEVKYRVDDHDELSRRLKGRGAVDGPAIDQVDSYLSHPSRDFGRTNEALRIRRVGATNRITYKGPKRSGPTKTREEIELPFADGEAAFESLRKLFANLGFEPLLVIRKSRRPFGLSYKGRPIEVALDEAEGLGRYAEVESIATDEGDLAAAQGAVLELAKELGLTEVEPRSYLRMALERRGMAAVDMQAT